MTRCAVMVLPLRPSGATPFAPWVTTTGWARGMAAEVGDAVVLTPDGHVELDDLVEVPGAGAPPDDPVRTALSRTARRLVPAALMELQADVRRQRGAAAMRRVVERAGDLDDVALVWQRHALFHDAGLRLARRLEVPFVLSMHAALIEEAASWGVRRGPFAPVARAAGESRTVRASDLVACVSDEVAEAAIRMGASADRVIVTSNGVDTDRFRPAPGPGDGRTPVVGWVGSFRPFHGVDLLLESAARVRREVDLQVRLVGDGTHRAVVEQQVADRGLSGVEFRGPVPWAAMPGELADLDIGVVVHDGAGPFHYSPVKLREYLACGLAVVAPRIGEIPRWVADGEEAVLYDPTDPRGLDDALRAVCADAALRQRLGAAGRRRVERDGSWRHRARDAVERLRALGHHVATSGE